MSSHYSGKEKKRFNNKIIWNQKNQTKQHIKEVALKTKINNHN